MEITSEDFNEWRANPVTREVFQILRERMEKIAYGLAEGACEDMAQYSEAVGRFKEISDLIKMDYEDMHA